MVNVSNVVIEASPRVSVKPAQPKEFMQRYFHVSDHAMADFQIALVQSLARSISIPPEALTQPSGFARREFTREHMNYPTPRCDSIQDRNASIAARYAIEYGPARRESPNVRFERTASGYIARLPRGAISHLLAFGEVSLGGVIRPPRLVVKEPYREIDLEGLARVLEASIAQARFQMERWDRCLIGSFCRAHPDDQLMLSDRGPRLGVAGPSGPQAVAIRFGITYIEACWLFIGLPADLFNANCPDAANLSKSEGIARLTKFIAHKRRSQQLSLAV